MARCFAALAHPRRVDILKLLLGRMERGTTFGGLAKDTGLPPSTLTHHLKEMELAGVITRTASGRSTMIALDLETLRQILATLSEICCPVTDQSDQGDLS